MCECECSFTENMHPTDNHSRNKKELPIGTKILVFRESRQVCHHSISPALGPCSPPLWTSPFCLSLCLFLFFPSIIHKSKMAHHFVLLILGSGTAVQNRWTWGKSAWSTFHGVLYFYSSKFKSTVIGSIQDPRFWSSLSFVILRKGEAHGRITINTRALRRHKCLLVI